MRNSTDLASIICAILAAEYAGKPVAQIGMFDHGDPDSRDLPAAQQQFHEMLAGIIADAHRSPARLLLAGAALEPLAQMLVARDYSPVWRNDVFSRPAAGTHPEAVADTGFDCVVVAGTYTYLDQLAIFNRCRELLAPGGSLLLFGEFLADDSTIAYSALANLSSQRQLSARLGFQSQKTWDLSEDALLSVNCFLALLARHADAVCSQSSQFAGMREEAAAVLGTMSHELHTGRRVYQLQHWSLPAITGDSQQDDRLGEYANAEYGDIQSFAVAEIRHLFEQSFEKQFDEALWHWKYQAGNGKCVVARISRGGDIVAHYGGAPRKIRYFGEPALAIQVCDVMVLPEKRRQYGKNSLFFKVAATFLEREIGNSVGHLLGFGFPNQSAMNIATRLGLYEKTDDFVEIVFAAQEGDQSPTQYVDLNAGDASHLQQIDHLWQLMLADFHAGIIGIRDSAYVRYRYVDHPGAERGQYRCLLLQDATIPESLAFVVLKQHGESQLLLDMICPADRFPAVITTVNQLVKAEYPGHDLRLWLTRGWLGAIPLTGAIVKELNIEIPCNSWNPGPTSAALYGKWWLTAGDMDFM